MNSWLEALLLTAPFTGAGVIAAFLNWWHDPRRKKSPHSYRKKSPHSYIHVHYGRDGSRKVIR